MPIKRTFIDWSQPALPQAVEFLIAHYANSAEIDLNQVVAVVPGSRAGRRLLELLVHESDQRSLVLYPPHIETMGSLPELLYETKRPFASDLVQQLAWLRALKSLGGNRLQELMPQVSTLR